ncbi:hypothetical protein Vi05172_g12633 [Venturia inaequalis]|nr:hypothetical protein Vi05172_g12633 [Venturia inaequalis]
MAAIKKTYFRANSFIWPAENGPVKLGSIISSRTTPHEPKGSPDFALPKQVYELEQPKWENSKAKHREGLVGIWARFINGIGPEAEASSGWGSRNEEKYQFDKMVWRYFVADEDYIDERMNDTKLQAFLVDHKKPVYMITGLMIAHNPKALTVVGHNYSLKGNAGAQYAGVGQIGPKAEFLWGKKDQTSFEGGPSFVFAFQLKEIWYKTVKKSRVLKSKDMTKGALYNDDEPLEEQVMAHDTVEVAQALGMSEETLTAHEAGVKVEKIEVALDGVDGKECEVVVFDA